MISFNYRTSPTLFELYKTKWFNDNLSYVANVPKVLIVWAHHEAIACETFNIFITLLQVIDNAHVVNQDVKDMGLIDERYVEESNKRGRWCGSIISLLAKHSKELI